MAKSAGSTVQKASQLVTKQNTTAAQNRFANAVRDALTTSSSSTNDTASVGVPSNLSALSAGVQNLISDINSGKYQKSGSSGGSSGATSAWMAMKNGGTPGSYSNVSVAQTGLAIYRNLEQFKCSWKLGSGGYALGQEFKYSVNGGAAVSVSVSKTQTSVTLNLGRGVASLTFCVRGRSQRTKAETSSNGIMSDFSFSESTNDIFSYKKSKTKEVKENLEWSEWATYTWKANNYPADPKITYTLSASNKGKFAFTAEGEETGNKVVEGVIWQSVYVHNAADGEKQNWKSCTKGQVSAEKSKVDDSVSFTEPSATDGGVRWFRAAVLTALGYGGWSYEKHAYSTPHAAVLKSVAAKLMSSGVTSITSVFTVSRNTQYPIDAVTTQYVITKPAASCTCPSGASWQEGLSTTPSGSSGKHCFNVDDSIDEDECLFVRILTEHDDNKNYSGVKIAQKGKLKKPGTPIVSNVSTTNGTATITADNDSGVSDAFLVVYYRSEKTPKTLYVVGIIQPGSGSTSVTIPELKTVSTYSFGVRAVVGSYKSQIRANGMVTYTVKTLMQSDDAWVSGVSARPPENVAAEVISDGTVKVTWDWKWSVANLASIAWADHEDAWESTSEPNIYEIAEKATSWNISDLEMGKVYYIRVRLNYEDDDGDVTYGPWSSTVKCDLGTAPEKPILTVSASTRSEDQAVTVTWTYTSTDGTDQEYAELISCTVSGTNIKNGKEIAHAETERGMTFMPDWKTDTTNWMRVRTVSASGYKSEWSDPVSVYTVAPLKAVIESTTLDTSEDDGVPILTEMPLGVEVSGAGITGIVAVSVIRVNEYHIYRPDETVRDGYEGETVASFYQVGDGLVYIGFDTLLGYLDDGAQYKIVATVSDDYGQSSSAEMEFRVEWEHKSNIPDITAEADNLALISKIKVDKPEGYEDGDVVDIYRLSADKPELIVSNGSYDTTYVDPYPAFGILGGHRIVAKSKNDDYVTEDGELSWVDTTRMGDDYLGQKGVVIDFNGLQLTLPYNNSIDNSWKKDFERTVYLGGSVAGDWNPGVTRDMSITCDATMRTELDTIALIRRLAEYPGICHVRTEEGSSFDADVQVSENTPYNKRNVTFDFSIQKVDPQSYAGVPLDEWLANGGS